MYVIRFIGEITGAISANVCELDNGRVWHVYICVCVCISVFKKISSVETVRLCPICHLNTEFSEKADGDCGLVCGCFIHKKINNGALPRG